MSDSPSIQVVDQFDPLAMQAFRRRPDVYWPAADALSPQPDTMDFVGHMLHPDIWTVAGTLGGHIFGYCEFNRRTSVGAEFHVGFHPQFRGKIALEVCRFAIGRAFGEKGLVKLWSPIASDNRGAVLGALRLGFREEGRLTAAIVRQVEHGPPLRDLVIMALSKEIPSHG
jgi:RimJ/RimL family protein N-acetyltransferase